MWKAECETGGMQVGAFPHYGGRWAEWNGRFRDTVRTFIKAGTTLPRSPMFSRFQPCVRPDSRLQRCCTTAH